MTLQPNLIIMTVLCVTASWPASAAEGQPEGGATMKPPMQGSQDAMDKQMQEMQDHMLKMHDLMHRIREAKDPQEIQRLKQEQLSLMKAHMRDMKRHGPSRMEGHMEERRPEMPR